jgi:membrane protease YdiL (CAAX protease family)
MLKPRGGVALYWIIAFGFSWAFWVPLALAESGVVTIPESVLEFLQSGRNPAAWGPLVAALVLTFAHEGTGGLRDLLRRALDFRLGLRWYAVVLVLLPLLLGVGLLAARVAGDDIPPSAALEQAGETPLAIFALIAFAFIFVLGGPLQEEFGWRGYLLPRLQARWSGLTASVIVGLAWGLWHLPLFFVAREEAYYNRPVLGLVLTTVGLSILFTWISNHTRGSLFAALLFHTSFNWSNFLMSTLYTDTGGLLWFGLLAAIIAAIVWRGGLEPRREG